MTRNLLVVFVVSASATFQVSPAAAQGNTSIDSRRGDLQNRFVGSWKLASVEQWNVQRDVVAPAVSAATTLPTGYLIYDSAGYMAVSIMPVGRKKYTAPQPTDDEALAAITGYTAYFGTFTISEKEQAIIHHLEGSLNPGMRHDQKRGFKFSGSRLTLTGSPAPNGNQARWTWERMPEMANPTAEHRRFIGFWKLVSNERRNQRGELLSSNPGQFGYIIYTGAGFMMTHTVGLDVLSGVQGAGLVPPTRKPYASGQATPQEARQTLTTYTNYFGPFYLHEADGYIVHDQIGSLSTGRTSPSPQQRYYQFVGNRLLLQPPPMYGSDGETIQGTLTWERVAATSRANR
jgi:hypothetical protein